MTSGETHLLDPWLARELVCPRDKRELRVEHDELVCAGNHRYAVVDGVPVMLLSGVRQTQREGERSLEMAANRGERRLIAPKADAPAGVDAFVQQVIGATGGYFYQPLIGRLAEYPIPQLRVAAARGTDDHFLELGCNWGRWCIGASRLGFRAVGIDHNLEAILAARRVARQLGTRAYYLVADARYLPFRQASFEVVFSYSVLQHFGKSDAELAIAEAGRVLKPWGSAVVQMPSRFGLRSLYHQLRRGFRDPRGFEVRYWRPAELRSTFSRLVGPATLSVDS